MNHRWQGTCLSVGSSFTETGNFWVPTAHGFLGQVQGSSRDPASRRGPQTSDSGALCHVNTEAWALCGQGWTQAQGLTGASPWNKHSGWEEHQPLRCWSGQILSLGLWHVLLRRPWPTHRSAITSFGSLKPWLWTVSMTPWGRPACGEWSWTSEACPLATLRIKIFITPCCSSTQNKSSFSWGGQSFLFQRLSTPFYKIKDILTPFN